MCDLHMFTTFFFPNKTLFSTIASFVDSFISKKFYKDLCTFELKL